MVLNVKQEALEAEGRIKGHIRETPLKHSIYLSRLGGCSVHLKLENLQITNSFKFRGAVNKFLSLSEEEKKGRLVTASSNR